MNIITHREIDQKLCGKPIELSERYSKVELKTTTEMAVDSTGLVHGGFVFGQADYAAMIAVNHPNVVLGGAETRFLKPVKAGEILIAEANVTEVKGKKNTAVVTVSRNSEAVFEGTFFCFVLEKHVLK
jgi:acyl-coenzyme A thioesterase PaaI-like protein